MRKRRHRQRVSRLAVVCIASKETTANDFFMPWSLASQSAPVSRARDSSAVASLTRATVLRQSASVTGADERSDMHLTTTAGVFLIVAVLFALGDWFAVSGRATSRTMRLEYICKPIVPLALIAATVATPPTPVCARGWFVAAFGFCLVGDVLLMLPGDRLEAFGGGLGSFLLAQGCFIIAFVKMGASWVATTIAFAVLVVLAFIPARAVVQIDWTQ